jgi:hypothetical protein
MMLNPAIAAAERTETARRLIAQAQADVVDLVVLSALDLCVLDGPRQPVFEQRVAQAWMQVTARRRRKITEEVTAGLVRRGLLIDGAPQHRAVQAVSSYSFKPELGLTLAARCRPAFVVLAKGRLRSRAMRCPCGIWCPPTARTASTRSATISGFRQTGSGRSWTGPASAARSRSDMTLKGSAESCLTCSPGHHDE